MASATRESGSAARSAARRWYDTAMERRGAQAFSDCKEGPAPQGAAFGRRAALHPLGFAEGTEGKAGRPGPSTTGAPAHARRIPMQSAAAHRTLAPARGGL